MGGLQWGEDVYSSMDAAFREQLTPFWQQSLYLSAFGVQLDPGMVKLFFGRCARLASFYCGGKTSGRESFYAPIL